MHFAGVDNLGILFKGKSIEQIDRIAGHFEHAFIVNNFDLEYNLVAPHLKSVRVIQFVNKLQTAVMTKSHYKGLGIKHIQTNMAAVSDKNTKALKKMKGWYGKFGLKVHDLPRGLLEFNSFFVERGMPDYAEKHPNTGLLALCYTIGLIKPAKVFMCGLDFYEADYKFRRPHQNPQKVQQAKMKRTHMVEHFVELVKSSPGIHFTLCSYNTSLPDDVPNLEVLR
jgi:hypothetical protein